MHIILLESLVEFDGFIYMYFIYFVIGRKAVFLNSQLPGDDDVSIYIAIWLTKREFYVFQTHLEISFLSITFDLEN